MLTNGRETEKSVCFTYIFSFCAIGSVNMKVNVGDRVEMKKPHPCGCKEFEIEKGRLSFRLTAPYSEERRQKASENAKQNGFNVQAMM